MAGRAPKSERTKGEPFTVRLTAVTQQAIEDEARRSRRTRTALVEELIDEALRTRRFPGIAFRDSFPHRRAWLIGAGIDVWELCDLVDRYPDVDTLLEDFPGIAHRHVELALAYRDAFSDEIAEQIAENERDPQEWRRIAPFIRDARR
ncbi:MAG TPA: hypothetical protein VFN99_04540 [Gaiella sp.]|nr:hypothetical protein [Gaiella sp.]